MHEELLNRLAVAFRQVQRPATITRSLARALDDDWDVSASRRSELRNQDEETHWSDLSDAERPSETYADGEDRLNAWIAGTLAYARIAREAGDAGEEERALARLAELLADRILLEKAGRAFVLGQEHRAKLARYNGTTPDSLRLLGRFAGEALEILVRALAAQGPSWPHAWGDILMGGENLTHSPALARGLFLAFADGIGATPEELARYLDQPLCRADLYQIEKLAALLRRCGGAG